jgi:hypothetical protein
MGIIQQTFFLEPIGMHLVHLDHFNARSRADGINGFAMRLDPVVDGYMAAFQEPPNGTEIKPFKVKLKRLLLGLWLSLDTGQTVCLCP